MANGIEIYTGYYGNVRKYRAAGCLAIGISVGTPQWLKDDDDKALVFYRALAPTYNLIHIEDEAEYTRRYEQEILAKLNPNLVLGDLIRMAKAQEAHKIILLCYEKPPKFCHRSLVAKWLNKTTGAGVCEFGFETAVASKKETTAPVAGDLFAAAGIEISAKHEEECKGWSGGDWR